MGTTLLIAVIFVCGAGLAFFLRNYGERPAERVAAAPTPSLYVSALECKAGEGQLTATVVNRGRQALQSLSLTFRLLGADGARVGAVQAVAGAGPLAGGESVEIQGPLPPLAFTRCELDVAIADGAMAKVDVIP